MKLQKLGIGISGAEVSNISRQGVWVLVKGREYFLSYQRCPWFKKASASQLRQVALSRGKYLRWKELDVDLELESLEHPEKYPLIFI